jgi:flagellin
MAMVINSNIASLTSQRHLSQSRHDMEVAMERMSSGSRINSSMDDAAGLAIGNRMTSQIEGLNQAIRNANDGISLAQTAEGALDSHSDVLQRMRVLAIQSANDTYSTIDRKTLNNEIVQLKEELNRSVSQATFNGKKILDGTNTSFTFQVGHTAQDTVEVTLSNMSGSLIGTQTWADKAGVTAPLTASAVAGLPTGGIIAGAAAGTNGVTGASGGSTAAAIDVVLTAGSSQDDIAEITVEGITVSHTFEAATATPILAAAAYAAAWNADAAGSAAYTADNNSSDTITFTATSVVDAATATATAAYTQAPVTAEQESYDFSGITLTTGDRLTITIGSNTYTQEFATDQETTLNALGALVVNGEAGYVSKGVDSGALVFVGNTDGTAMTAAVMVIETASVTAANSIDDVLVTDSTSAKHALTVVDNALEMMADFRSRMGAVSNRMFHTIDNLMSISENTSAARSRIVDADFAAESASLAKSQILQKAGTAMLSQANASTQDILSLLK